MVSWDIEELPKPTDDIELMHYQLDEFGYCLIKDALPKHTLTTLQTRMIEQAELERSMHNHKNPANVDPVNQWVGMLLNKGEVFMELIEHEVCMGLLEYMLGAEYLISCVDAQIQHPGSVDMPLHTDQWWMPIPLSPDRARSRPADLARGQNGSIDPSPAQGPVADIAEANVMWMVTDFTEENGATRVVPRSHRSGRQPDPSVPHPVETVAAAGPAGTAIAFDGRLWHSGAANRTSTSRYGITSAGCGPQFRQIENYTRGMRPEVFARSTPDTLARLGFKSWSGYGHTGNPEELVASLGEDSMGPLYHETTKAD
ncbi:MAG: phytanoyl-CoA dioxygenase family protein [Pseudomonadota bacterium]